MVVLIRPHEHHQTDGFRVLEGGKTYALNCRATATASHHDDGGRSDARHAGLGVEAAAGNGQRIMPTTAMAQEREKDDLATWAEDGRKDVDRA